MEKIREYNGWVLNKGDLMASGLWNVSNTEKNEYAVHQLSYWFDEETKNELLAMNDKEFEKKCIAICNPSF